VKSKKYPNAAAARRAIREKAQVEGAQIAYAAALELCRDKNAPAQARSAAIASIFRVGGLFERAHDDDLAVKSDHEMTADELNASIAQGRHHLEQQLAAMRRAREARGETGPLADEDYDLAAAHNLEFDEEDENDESDDGTPSAFG
jgi:hypothetical protein